jgi:hypothetical protein
MTAPCRCTRPPILDSLGNHSPTCPARHRPAGQRRAPAPRRQPARDPDALGPCGCTDYHMADCPTRWHDADYWAPEPGDPDYD